MPTNYPASLDVFQNPVPGDYLDTAGVLHDEQHGNANDAIEALEAKVGANGSGVAASHDFKLSEVSTGGQDKAVGKAAVQTLTNKTLGVGWKVVLGSDAQGDIWYRETDGVVTRLGVGTTGQVLAVVSGKPAWVTLTPMGEGSPEGAVTAVPGQFYLDTLIDGLWYKKTGTGNTGWVQLIG